MTFLSSNAQNTTENILTVCTMPTTDEVNRTYTPTSESILSRSTPCSDFQVTYIGFAGFPEAQAAFERAVAIWENVLDSPVTIRVRAEFETLGAGVLGSARPFTYLEVPGKEPGVLYAAALAEQLIGEDRDGPGGISFDITCNFSNTTNWYFGTDPNSIGNNQFDFTTVVLHELGHGLGFAGFGGRSNNLGALRRSSNGAFFNNTASGGFISIWDTFIEGPNIILQKFPITDENTFPDPSNQMLGAFRSDELTCTSPIAIAQNGGDEPKTYAPSTFNQGSTYSHWDESTFNSTPDALMTPQVAREEINLNIGNVTQGFMEDMGWSLCQGSLSTNNFALENVKISPNPFTQSITIELPSQITNQEFNVSIVDINGRIVSNSEANNTNGQITISNLDNLKNTLYFLTIESKTSDLSITKKIIKQ
ncbi:hypothetical protein GCM10011444_07460 [Winogradskyella haliclonae]|uniref:Secretion system C-terminal sorting domain-containing protein n=2 Tax=Winogradskyella haliclonae TaxID=2048558 RepID=A0ABQ2BXD2_9FLAO|nr:hypothetical protein GCM10011444_07460 [Winogradskyella haliclonae]